MPEELNQGQIEEVQEEQPQIEETEGELSDPEQPTEEPQEGGELPEDVKERTRKEFEKLKQHNAELKKQLDERQNMPSVLDFLNGPSREVPSQVRQQYIQPVNMPSYQQAPPPQQPAPQLVDDQGYVNTEVLQRELDEARKARERAEEAERRARDTEERVSRFEINQETQRLYQSYPELDPQSEHFNQDAYELVKNDLTSQLINTGKRDAIKSAERMSKFFRLQPQQQARTQEVLEQRKQASVPGNVPRPQSDPDLIKRRDPDGIQARLKALGL